MRFYILLITTVVALVSAAPVPEADIGCCVEAERLTARCVGFIAVSDGRIIL